MFENSRLRGVREQKIHFPRTHPYYYEHLGETEPAGLDIDKIITDIP